MKKYLIFSILFFTPIFAFAQNVFTYGAWIPYWRKEFGVSEVLPQLNKLDYINLFSFEIDKNGKPKDTLKIEKSPWPNLIARAREQQKKVIATFSWFKGTEIDTILSNPENRTKHINTIIDMAKKYQLSGIDIDYENKLFKSKISFNIFLDELKKSATSNKLELYCTIEPRTPPVDQYLTIPKNIDYVNDYTIIAKTCDKVIIMAYDQRRIDITLNRLKGSVNPYVPVADNDWVKKVITLTMLEIPKEKIILGIPTFGHEYIIEKNKLGKWQYYRVGSLTYKRAQELVQLKKLEHTRNLSGEMTFIYKEDDEQRFGVFYDQGAIQAKIELARNLGLSGVSLFKIDGESDSSLWNIITH